MHFPMGFSVGGNSLDRHQLASGNAEKTAGLTDVKLSSAFLSFIADK